MLKKGDDVIVLPSGMTTTIAAIDLSEREIDEAYPPMSVTVRLSDDVDVGRGDMIARVNNQPAQTQDLDAMICWMSTSPVQPRQKLLIKHTTRLVKGIVRGVDYRLDVNTLHRDQDATELGLNEMGRVTLRVQQPVMVDAYEQNRITGSFIVVDPSTGVTVGAGMVRV